MTTPGTAAGALDRPSYLAGDRWVYVLEGSLDALPGLNGSGVGRFSLSTAGRVEVQVLGAAERTVRESLIRGVDVSTSVSGFLNGTFSVPGLPGPPASVTGTFTSATTELWEDRGYFAVESRGTAAYTADVTVPPFTSRFSVASRMNANSSVVQGATFPLDVGKNASASLQTNLLVNATISFPGRVFSSENATSFASAWKRVVLAREVVSVEAGTFSVYRLNQTVNAFPGLGAVALSPGSNETAYWSNDVRNYVKRDLYVNNSRVSEIRLKSFTPGQSGPALLVSLLVIGVPLIVGAFVILMLLLRLRKRRAAAIEQTPSLAEGMPPPPPPDAPTLEGGENHSR